VPSRRVKLGLKDAVSMAVGGMIGGGIFTVLGDSVILSGNAAFIAFGIGGIIALITGLSLSHLTVSFGEKCGSFNFIRALAGPKVEGFMSWLMIFGYIFTISLYAYTLGAYGGKLLGLDRGLNGIVGAGGIILFTIINFMGIKESGITEDILVFSKVGILIFISILGLMVVKETEMFPILEHGPLSIIAASALIFVAYEGFELVGFDYGDIENPGQTLPHVIIISISIVMALYMVVAFVTTSTLDDAVIITHAETALAYVAEPLLGHVGFVIVLIAAVFSSSSAINATMFSTARLAKQASVDNQLPHELIEKEMGGMPLNFTLLVSGSAIVIQYVGNVEQIAGVSSMVFLSLFSMVNLSATLHKEYPGWKGILPVFGFIGCLVSMLFLCYRLLEDDPLVVLTMLVVLILVVLLREAFTRKHPSFLRAYGHLYR